MLKRNASKKLALIGDGIMYDEILSLIKMVLRSSNEVLYQFTDNVDTEDPLNIENFDPQIYTALVCVERPNERQYIIDEIMPNNTEYFSFIFGKLIGNDITIGNGCIIYPESIIFDKTTIGCHSIIYPCSVISFGSNIGNFVTIGMGAKIARNGFVDDGETIYVNEIVNSINEV